MEPNTLGKSILVIEDDGAIRETLKLILELEGFIVYSAENGAKGLEKLIKLGAPCLIILDLMMPVMDGWTFMEATKKYVGLAAIPIVILTAFAEKAEALSKTRDVLKKPIDIPVLVGAIRKYCNPKKGSP